MIARVNGTGVGVMGVGVAVGALLVCATWVNATATVCVKSTEFGVGVSGSKIIGVGDGPRLDVGEGNGGG